MKLQVYGPMGMVPMVVNDDISMEELRKRIFIATTVEQGNGKSRKINMEVQNGNSIKSE